MFLLLQYLVDVISKVAWKHASYRYEQDQIGRWNRMQYVQALKRFRPAFPREFTFVMRLPTETTS